uniref:Uncharacterized protein n=1 Tax=Desertifilum tharense IPPAS B-1220 TaxID=1781255 RepID=A0ACD5GNY0_9CYAN
MAEINCLDGDNITNLREDLHDEENISYNDFDQILQIASEVLERCLDRGENGSVKGLIYVPCSKWKNSRYSNNDGFVPQITGLIIL